MYAGLLMTAQKTVSQTFAEGSSIRATSLSASVREEHYFLPQVLE